jgi:hypothetical protein
LTSLEEAEGWLKQAGVCLFQTKQGIELPSLFGAIAGSDRPAPRWGQHDAAYGRAWDWKDHLMSSRRIFYGKALGDYRLFLSLEMFPYLFALSDFNYGGDEDDYLELYADGKLSITGRNLYEAIAGRGPVSTTLLRRTLGFSGGEDSRRFERGLTELQRGLLIAPVGIARDNRWKYTFAYQTTLHQWPDLIAQARGLARPQATKEVLRRYLCLAGGGPISKIATLFGWQEGPLRRLVTELDSAQTLGWDEPSGIIWDLDLVGEP